MITAIVPAYNEEKQIAPVLETLSQSKHVQEVICINDGSTDGTLTTIKKFPRVKLINLKKNHGKAYAIAQGIQHASGEIVIFIDADLQGLSDNSLKQLSQPLLSGGYEVAIGYPTSMQTDKFFRPLSGERAYFRRDLIPYIGKFKKKGYGLELYLNYLFKDRKVKLLPLRGISNTLKYDKQSYDTAAKLLIVEMIDLLSEIMKQKNPLSYLIGSYFFPFYFKNGKQTKNSKHINKITEYIKRNIMNTFKV